MTESRRDLWSTHGAGTAGSPSTLARTPAAPGATAPTRRRALRPWWLVALLALLALGALLLGLSRCSAQRDAAPAPVTPAPAAPAPAFPTAGAAGAAAAGPAGSLVAGATSLFDAARTGDRGLVALVGQTAVAHAVPVQSVVADEGFWVGGSEADRVWVQLSANDESAITIAPGQLLDLSGPVVSHGPDFAGKAGVTADEGAAQLTREGAHLEVDPNQVTVVGAR
jgi:hypothetical protein